MKTEFKGTPKTGANWAINVNNPRQTLIENVCIIDEGYSVPGVKEDAHLIASAPDLLEALQKVYAIAVECNLLETLNSEENNYIENAIKKALNL